MESFKHDLRGVLIAEKEGIKINYLAKEFRDLTGEEIEEKYDHNLYSNLKEFLQSIPDTCIIKQ